MNRRTAIRGLAAWPLATWFRAGDATAQDAKRWTPVFNGADLTGWETFLGKPNRDADAPIGVNRDPTSVFSVVTVDGAPAIRISGETYGALTTLDTFGDYHLRFEFKWGERRWPPRETAVRDSGCCYHAVGPHGASYGFWMRSCEFQIQEGDCGDFYSLAGTVVDAEAVRPDPENPKSEPIYRKGSPALVGHTKRIVKSGAFEKPRDEWNTLELYCAGQSSAHVVNGRVTMMLTGIRHRVDGREVPLTRGRIQFQSEGAEVFYRNITVRPLREVPANLPG